MPDELPEFAGNVLLGCFPGCILSVLIPLCSFGAIFAFATGHAHEGWTQLAIVGLGTLWALTPIVRRLWRHMDP